MKGLFIPKELMPEVLAALKRTNIKLYNELKAELDNLGKAGDNDGKDT